MKKNIYLSRIVILFWIGMIFIDMKKDKHLRIRINQEQLTRLIQRLDQENKRKSTLLRELIDIYLNKTCREDSNDK